MTPIRVNSLGAAVALALFATCAPCAMAANKTMEGTVAYVTGGDTLVLDDGTTVHYIGIQAPSHSAKPGSGSPFGREAFELNRKLVAGRRVRLELDARDRDPRGDLLAYVYVGKYFVNASLVQSGYAKVAVHSPNTRYAALFERLQAEAKADKRGLWKLPQAAAPTFNNSALGFDESSPAGSASSPRPAGKVFGNEDLAPFDIPDEPEPAPPAESSDDKGKDPAGAKGEGDAKADAPPSEKPDAATDKPVIPPTKGK